MALNAPYLPPPPLRPQAVGGKNQPEGTAGKKEIASNVADDPAYTRLKAALEQELMDELTRTGDPRLINEGKFFEIPPMARPLMDAGQLRNRERGGDGKGK